MDKRSIIKRADLQTESVSPEDLAKINQYTLKELSADEVFVFKAIAGDNHLDDRNFEPFSAKAIDDMVEKYPGQPLMFDHNHRDGCDSIVGRVFDAYTEDMPEKNADGEPVRQLILKMYMLRSDKNENLIREIEAGIRSSVSTATCPEKLVCSVCGTDNMQDYCHHWPGKTYDGKLCTFKIDGVKYAQELSFVYAGAQPRARTIKAFNPDLPDLEYKKETNKVQEDSNLEELMLDTELFLMAETAEGENDE